MGARRVVGMRNPLSNGGAETAQLWQRFMPRRGEIRRRIGTDYISMRVFHNSVHEAVTPATAFDEWAAVEVSGLEDLPEGMDAYTLPGGVYAVFLHRGPAATFPETAHYIYGTWIPGSEYELDNRPHFAVMPADYRPDDAEAEEEFWIPVRRT